MNQSDTDVEAAIKLLIVDRSPNNAQALTSTLRNAGFSVHAHSVSNTNQLLEALESNDFEMVLCSADRCLGEINTTIDQCLVSAPDATLILIYAEQPPEVLLDAMRHGARDVVAEEDTPHLQLVFERERRDLRIRQRLAQATTALAESESRCTSLIEHSRDAIAYIHEGMHILANPAYLEMFGHIDQEELEGLPILDMISSAEQNKFKKVLRNLTAEQEPLQVECVDGSGKTFPAIMEFSSATIEGEPCIQIIIRNQSNDRELTEKIEMLSHQDNQTGLINRQYFMEELQRRMDSGLTEGSLYYLSIHDFPEIRARIGIEPSDQLLVQIANALISASEDRLVARFGDHSFTLFGESDGTLASEDYCQKLIQLLSGLDTGDYPEPIHCSIGISYLGESGGGAQELINQAYLACGVAQNSDTSSFSVFDPSEMTPSYGDAEPQTDDRYKELIDHALEHDRFRLLYQPIVSLQGDSRENYSVLLRLLDHNNQEIEPADFLHSARQNNRMLEIDQWVIQHALVELVKQRESGRKVNFFISLSAETIEDQGLLLWICDQLREYKAKGPWFTFQIRDGDLRTRLQPARKLIEGLKKIKCQVAIDQFGSNPKPDTLLKHIPVDYVRFDAELTRQLSGQQEHQDQLNRLNTLAGSHKVKTIATGVEDANSLAILWTVGVSYIQGHFLQEPSPTIAYEFNTA